jgi:hypothetical protein
MNQADILKLAEAAGFQQVTFNGSGFTGIFACVAGQNLEPELTRFAELVAQHEAKVREELIARYDSLQSQYAELPVALDSAQHERGLSGKAVEVLRELAALEILQSDANAISFAGPLSRFGDKWEDEYKRLRKEWTRRQLIVRRKSEEILRAEAIRAGGAK